jgi:hypothetical protein
MTPTQRWGLLIFTGVSPWVVGLLIRGDSYNGLIPMGLFAAFGFALFLFGHRSVELSTPITIKQITGIVMYTSGWIFAATIATIAKQGDSEPTLLLVFAVIAVVFGREWFMDSK